MDTFGCHLMRAWLARGALQAQAAEQRGFRDVRIPDVTASSDFAAPLRSATAVWFGGGSKQRIADAYHDTLSRRNCSNCFGEAEFNVDAFGNGQAEPLAAR